MSSELRKRPEGPAWDTASKSRGLANLQLALDFVANFPIGTIVRANEFDAWAAQQDLIKVPHPESDKQGDAWKAHLMRRHELRYRINNAGAHPRLRDHGSTPFSFDTVTPGLYEVRQPYQAATRSNIPSKVASFINTKQKQLAYLMQSEDWTALAPWDRIAAKTLYRDIAAFKRRIDADAKELIEKFDELEAQLRSAVEVGDINPRNGGIKQLSTPDLLDGDDSDKTG
jgi:hypothetical protein